MQRVAEALDMNEHASLYSSSSSCAGLWCSLPFKVSQAATTTILSPPSPHPPPVEQGRAGQAGASLGGPVGQPMG